jgi:hypothetical protein
MTFLKITNYKTLYGERTTTIAKNLERLMIKQAKIKEHINLLKRCRDQNVIPKGFIIKHQSDNYQNRLTQQNTMIKMRDNVLRYRYK